MNLTKVRHLPTGRLNFCAKTTAGPTFCRTRVSGATEPGLTLIPAQQSRQTFSVGECLKSPNCAHPARTSRHAHPHTRIKESPDRPMAGQHDVCEGKQHVGPIMRMHAAPTDHRWFWTIMARVPQSAYDRGYASTREEAMAAFTAQWADYSMHQE